MTGIAQVGIGLEELERVGMGAGDELRVIDDVDELEGLRTMLPAAEHVTLVSGAQVGLGKLEAIRGAHEGVHARLGFGIVLAGICHEKDRSGMLAAAHAAA